MTIENAYSLIFGILIGIALTLVIMGNSGVIAAYHEAKELCEVNLPRSEECHMVFVPTTKEIKS